MKITLKYHMNSPQPWGIDTGLQEHQQSVWSSTVSSSYGLSPMPLPLALPSRQLVSPRKHGLLVTEAHSSGGFLRGVQNLRTLLEVQISKSKFFLISYKMH